MEAKRQVSLNECNVYPCVISWDTLCQQITAYPRHPEIEQKNNANYVLPQIGQEKKTHESHDHDDRLDGKLMTAETRPEPVHEPSMFTLGFYAECKTCLISVISKTSLETVRS